MNVFHLATRSLLCQRFISRFLFKYFNAFLARIKSASVGDASLYDKHFVTNIRSGHSGNVLQFSNNSPE